MYTTKENLWSVYMFRPISGGSMNPARTIGPAIASGYYEAIWVYLIGPITGTLLGSWSYNLIRVTQNENPTNSLISPCSSFSFGRLRRSMRKNNTEAREEPPEDLV